MTHNSITKKKIANKKVKDAKKISLRKFSQLGYGTVAYFNLLEHLIFLFLILTLVALPEMYLLYEFGEN